MTNYREAPEGNEHPSPQALVRQLEQLEALQYAQDPQRRAEYQRIHEAVQHALERDPAMRDRPRYVKTKMHLRDFDELIEHLKSFHEIREPEPPPPEAHPLFEPARKWRLAAIGSLILLFGVPFNLAAVMYAHSAYDFVLKGNPGRADRALSGAKKLTVAAYGWGIVSGILWISVWTSG